LVCLNVSLANSDVDSITPSQVVQVTCAVVPDLHDKFILTANVIDRLSRCKTNTSIIVSQAQVNDDVNSPVVIDSGNDINKGVMNSSPLTLPQANDDVTTDEILTTAEQNVVCHDVDEDISDITGGGRIPTSDCSLSSSSEVAQEQHNDPSLSGCWNLADKSRAGFLVQDNLLCHHITILGQDVYQLVVPESHRPMC